MGRPDQGRRSWQSRLIVTRAPSEAGIHLGTSAFRADGWDTSFYPRGTNPADYLTYYGTKFDTVEIDSTFYHAPSAATVNGWARKTPDNFIFAVKVPQTITHEKLLQGADDDFKSFVETMDLLGEKLGPMLLQLPYFNRTKFKSGGEFIRLLKSFMQKFPRDHMFAVEIRNRNWLDARFADALRERNVALVLQDQSWMPRPKELFEKFDPITADFTYIRWLEDRKRIEEQTLMWDKVIVDRRAELTEWVEIVRKVHKRRIQVFAYANNHYAGHAPATVEMFSDLLGTVGPAEGRKPAQPEKERTLFER